MGFSTGSYAKVWSVEPGKGNFTKVRLSTSRKDRQTGQYEQDFGGFCTFVGQAHAAAQSLVPGDNIRLGDVSVTNSYNKETKVTYTNFNVFSFEKGTAPAQHSQPTPVESAPDDEEKLPF